MSTGPVGIPGLDWAGQRGAGPGPAIGYEATGGALSCRCLGLNITTQSTAAKAVETAPPPATHAHTGTLRKTEEPDEDESVSPAVAVAE